jgi:hypothetical protein
VIVFEREAAAAALREWLERQGRFAFALVEGPSPKGPVTLIEAACDKRLVFAFGQVVRVEEARAEASGSKYLRVLLDDGRSFAVAGAGIVFAPSFRSTGPLPECPETTCFADYRKLRAHLDHLEAGERGEALQVLMVLLAFLDGARAIGLDVSEEERDLERALARLEA